MVLVYYHLVMQFYAMNVGQHGLNYSSFMVLGRNIHWDLHVAWSVSAKYSQNILLSLSKRVRHGRFFCEFIFKSVCFICWYVITHDIFLIDHVMRKLNHIYCRDTAWYFFHPNKATEYQSLYFCPQVGTYVDLQNCYLNWALARTLPIMLLRVWEHI